MSRPYENVRISWRTLGLAIAFGMISIPFSIFLVVLTTVATPLAQRAQAGSSLERPTSAEILKSVHAILTAQPESVDFARAKLTFDQITDPSIDVQGSLRQIDGMVATIKAMAGPNASTLQKLRAVRTYIYVDGDWNGHRPFAYDLSDPLGQKPVNRLFSHYLATRQGNCVSMPILFVILADRIGLNVTLAEAPFHLFVKFTNDDGKAYNLETTSGAYPARDAYMRQQFPMTDEAVANGIYLRALSRREAIAVMASIILDDDVANGRYQEAVDVGDVILQAYPNHIWAMLKQATAYAYLIDVNFRAKYPTPRDIPASLWPQYVALTEKNRTAFERAEELGWRDEAAEIQ